MLKRLARGLHGVALRPLVRRRATRAALPPSMRRLPRRELDELLRLARASFVQTQAAWDRGDLEALGTLATEPLLAELRDQLQARGAVENRTEVLRLEARLLALEELRDAFIASVEFSGLIRERLGDAAMPFRELWLLADVKAAGRGWRLARVQSLS